MGAFRETGDLGPTLFQIVWNQHESHVVQIHWLNEISLRSYVSEFCSLAEIPDFIACKITTECA
jgi:hypothetical protein